MFEPVYQLIKNKQFAEAKEALESILKDADRTQSVEAYKLLFKIATMTNSPDVQQYAILLKQKYNMDIFNKVFSYYAEQKQYEEIAKALRARFELDKNEAHLQKTIEQLKAIYHMEDHYFSDILSQEGNRLLDHQDEEVLRNDRFMIPEASNVSINPVPQTVEPVEEAALNQREVEVEQPQPVIEQLRNEESTVPTKPKKKKKSIFKKLLTAVGVVAVLLVALIVWAATSEDNSSSENINVAAENEEKNAEEITEEAKEEKEEAAAEPAANEEETEEIDTEAMANEMMDGYLTSYVTGDASSLSTYVDMNSSFYNDQIAYMQSLKDRGITVYLNDYKIQQVTQIDDTHYQVIVNEAYDIDNPSKGSKTMTQRAVYTCAYEDDQFYITDMSLQ